MTQNHRLRLYEIADELDSHEIDNGPNGSYSPFRGIAKELRKIAGQKPDSSYSPHSGDFRDAPWEPR